MAEPSLFYVRGDDGQEYGPVALDELREWVRENRAGLGTNVRGDEAGSLWRPWQYYPELVALLAESRAQGVQLEAAPLGKRVLAFLVDLILCSILMTPILAVMEVLYMPNWNAELMNFLAHRNDPVTPEFSHYVVLGNLVIYAALLLYTAGFNAAHGKTPGKAMLRLRVVDSSGGKPSPASALMRGLVYVISLVLYAIPFFYILVNPQRRGLHDWVAGTMVVKA